ncbi:hypothetical protein PAXRUDRAFT_166916, partial [Paxillus rubicundulus Ve08.2h10]
KDVRSLAVKLGVPTLDILISDFLSDQHSSGDNSRPSAPHHPHLSFTGQINIFHSAAATFVSQSDLCGTGSMQHEHIRATPSWCRGPGRFNCALINTDASCNGMLSMDIVWILCFFSFVFTDGITYPCAVVLV